MVSEDLCEAIATGNFTLREIQLLFHLISRLRVGSAEVGAYTNVGAARALEASEATTSRAMKALEGRGIVRRYTRDAITDVVLNPNLVARVGDARRRELREQYAMPVRAVRTLRSAG
jgi:DNA-binding Lrp family transcriptional regulator